MLPQWIIEKKRDGGILTEEEIRFFIDEYTGGKIPDYQASALAMAIYLRGMNSQETAYLTEAMMNSGKLIDLSSILIPTADKHSTGGVGDKVSLVLAPLVAACGLAVPMLSGRGLGITGGTLDKLESIPGYRTDLSPAEFKNVLLDCGCSITGQTSEIAPADRKLYALRDVTGTVPSIPLICASIMSKKLAEGARVLVMDVKWGKGAFMKTLDSARELAASLVSTGARMGRKTSALLTDMNQPLGGAVGNTLEVIETVQSLKGRGPEDLMTVTMALAAEMLVLSEKAGSVEEAEAMLKQALHSGTAYGKFVRMVELHGGSTSHIENTGLFAQAGIKRAYRAESDGYVAEVDAEKIGRAGILLGGGRRIVTDKIDPAVGFTNIAKIGTKVKRGDILLVLHANDNERLEEAIPLIEETYAISAEKTEKVRLITERVKGS